MKTGRGRELSEGFCLSEEEDRSPRGTRRIGAPLDKHSNCEPKSARSNRGLILSVYWYIIILLYQNCEEILRALRKDSLGKVLESWDNNIQGILIGKDLEKVIFSRFFIEWYALLYTLTRCTFLFLHSEKFRINRKCFSNFIFMTRIHPGFRWNELKLNSCSFRTNSNKAWKSTAIVIECGLRWKNYFFGKLRNVFKIIIYIVVLYLIIKLGMTFKVKTRV